MNSTAKGYLDKLGTIGILALIAAAFALAFVIWGTGDGVAFWALLLGPLGTIGVVFTALWMLGCAVVAQLANSD